MRHGLALRADDPCRAKLTAIDLSETSVTATRRRLQLKGLAGQVIHGDAETLPFAEGDFDLSGRGA